MSMRRQAMGLGALGEDPFDGEYDYSTPPFVPSSSPAGFVDTWLGPLLAGAEKTISNIFAPAATSIAQAQAQMQPTYYQQNYPMNYPPNYRPPNQGVGFGIDSAGIRLSDGSHIGWVPIALVGLGIVLIQSRPFSRR